MDETLIEGSIIKLNNRAEKCRDKSQFSFIVMGDSHLYEINENPQNEMNKKNIDTYSEVLNSAKKNTDALFILHGGDGCDAGDEERLSAFKSKTIEILGDEYDSIPLFLTMGNHDYYVNDKTKKISRQPFIDIIGTAPGSKVPCGVIEIPFMKTAILQLDTGVYHDSQKHKAEFSQASKEILRGLKDRVSNNPNLHYIIDMHMPPRMGYWKDREDKFIREHTLSEESTNLIRESMNQSANNIDAVFLHHLHYFQVFHHKTERGKRIPLILTGGSGGAVHHYEHVHHHFLKVTIDIEMHRIIKLVKVDCLSPSLDYPGYIKQ